MIQFVITNGEITNTIECCLDDSILSLKTKIIEYFKLTSKYIDIDFKLDRPIRSLGKFNLESGIIPRSLDSYPFDRYGLEGKTVSATFIEINDYEPRKYDRSFKHVNLVEKYNPVDVVGIANDRVRYDITSEDDFPSLC
jgi:hypothetical protein